MSDSGRIYQIEWFSGMKKWVNPTAKIAQAESAWTTCSGHQDIIREIYFQPQAQIHEAI
jgi:hypothetical protein